MRRFLTCILTLAALLALTAPARADILWEPDDNAFYKSHREECSAEDRAYIANGGDGFVTAWDAPGGSQVRFQHVSVRIGQRQTVVAVSGPVPVSEVNRLQDGRELDGVIYGPHGRLLLLVVGTGRGRQYCGRQQRQQQGFFYSLHN